MPHSLARMSVADARTSTPVVPIQMDRYENPTPDETKKGANVELKEHHIIPDSTLQAFYGVVKGKYKSDVAQMVVAMPNSWADVTMAELERTNQITDKIDWGSTGLLKIGAEKAIAVAAAAPQLLAGVTDTVAQGITVAWTIHNIGYLVGKNRLPAVIADGVTWSQLGLAETSLTAAMTAFGQTARGQTIVQTLAAARTEWTNTKTGAHGAERSADVAGPYFEWFPGNLFVGPGERSF